MDIEPISEVRRQRPVAWQLPEPCDVAPAAPPQAAPMERLNQVLQSVLKLLDELLLQMAQQLRKLPGDEGDAGDAPPCGGPAPAAPAGPPGMGTPAPSQGTGGADAGAAPVSAAGRTAATAPTQGAAASPSTAAPNASAPDPAASTSQAAPSAPSGATGAVNGGGPNQLQLRNNTDQPMQVAFFRNLAPGEHPSFNGPEATFTIGAHQSMDVSMPADWQGRVQKWSGSTQDNANWAEINFEKSSGKIWFDESDIPGRNSSMKISAPDGAVAGSDRSLLAQAPADVVTTDSAGNRVIKAPQWFDGKTHQASVDFLDRSLGTRNAYVLPDDNDAVRVSQAHSLSIDFGEA